MRFKELLSVAILGVACLSGCRATTPAQALAPEIAGSDPDSQLEFWHALPQRKAVSNDEAFHALLLFVGEDGAKDYAGRVQSLKDRKMIPSGFNEPAESALRRGTLAVALAQALEIKGGLSMHLFGPRERYAVRELQSAGVYPVSSPQQTFSGPEFLGIIGRAEDYQRLQADEDVEAPAMEAQEPAAGGTGAAAGDGGI